MTTSTKCQESYVAEVGKKKVSAWSQDLLIHFPTSDGWSDADWVTLKWSELDGYEVSYEGDHQELVGWLDGILENDAIHLLDWYANGTLDQERHETDEQLARMGLACSDDS